MADAADGTRRTRAWAGYAAAFWAFLFAAVSFYWAGGGTLGAGTNSPDILGKASNPWFIALVWFAGALKVAAGLLALALAGRWRPPVRRALLLTAGCGAGLILTLYGGANIAVRALMSAGVINTPDSMRSTAARWHLLLWNPWFFGGGLLFLIAAWQYQRLSVNRRQSMPAIHPVE